MHKIGGQNRNNIKEKNMTARSDWSRITSYLAIITPTRGDYNTEALIFKMDTARFLDVVEEETKKMKENAVALIIT